MASPGSIAASDDAVSKPVEQITFRFCSECSNMLYPKEDTDNNRLQFTCRTCHYTEEASSTCVFRNVMNTSAGETAGVTQDVGSDPTVGDCHDEFLFVAKTCMFCCQLDSSNRFYEHAEPSHPNHMNELDEHLSDFCHMDIFIWSPVDRKTQISHGCLVWDFLTDQTIDNEMQARGYGFADTADGEVVDSFLCLSPIQIYHIQYQPPLTLDGGLGTSRHP